MDSEQEDDALLPSTQRDENETKKTVTQKFTNPSRVVMPFGSGLFEPTSKKKTQPLNTFVMEDKLIDNCLKLGFGMMRLPRVEGTKDIDLEHTKRMVDAFMEAGGKYFDTA